MKKRIISIVLTIAILLPLLPAAALAAEGSAVTLDISGGSIVITATGYSVGGGAETAYTGAYILTGTSSSHTVTVESGSHAITMQDLHIPRNTSDRTSPVYIKPNAEAIVTLLGENTLTVTGGPNDWSRAALRVPKDAFLTVTAASTGSLTANAEYMAAGIGGSSGEDAGTVNIHGGTINATGGEGAGIGGGAGYLQGGIAPGGGGHVVITGGIVNARSTINNRGAGIGGGGQHNQDGNAEPNAGGAAGIIEIRGGYVNVTGNPGIGCGNYATEGGSVSITGGFVTAYGSGGEPVGRGKGSNATVDRTFSNCILFTETREQSLQGVVYGDATMEHNYDVPSTGVLTIPKGATLTVSEGVTLNSFGTIQNNGRLTGTGTIYGKVEGNAPSDTLTYEEMAPAVEVRSEAELRAALEHEFWDVKLMDDFEVSSRLEIRNSGRLDGNGHTITLTGSVYHYHIGISSSQITVEISDLTLTAGGDTASNTLIYNDQSTLTLTNCLITGSGGTGVENNSGMITLTDCTISNNKGTGVDCRAAATLLRCLVIGNGRGVSGRPYLMNSIVTGNVDGGFGPGGLSVSGGASIVNSVLLGNHSLESGNRTPYDLYCAGRANELVTDSVVGVSKAWDETGLTLQAPGLVLDSHVNEGTALNEVFADLTTAEVNGTSISVPVVDNAKRGVAAVKPTKEWAGKLAADPKVIFWVEGYNGPYDHDSMMHGDIGLTVVSSLPCTAYFSTEELTAENYLETGRTDQYMIGPHGAGSKTIYYYIVRQGFPDVAGSAEIVVTKATQEPVDVTGRNIVFDAATMTLTKVYSSEEYSVDGGATWVTCQRSGTPTPVPGVTANQDILVRMAENDNYYASPAAVVPVDQQKKPTGVTAAQPNAAGEQGSISGITSDMEYRLESDTGWTAGADGAITGIAQGTTYLVRTKAAGNALPSDPIAVTVYVYDAAPAAKPNAAIDFEHETLTGLSGSVLVDGTPYNVTGALPIEESWLDRSVSIVQRGDGSTTKDSSAQELPIPARAVAPAVTATNEAYPGAADGKLGTDHTMEYRADGTAAWIACGGETTGLAAGTYLVRLKAAAGAFPGDSTKVTVGSNPVRQEAAPAATVSGDNSSLENLAAGAVYSINNLDYTADTDGRIAMLPDWCGTTIKIVKRGVGSATTDSPAQYMAIPAAGTYMVTLHTNGGTVGSGNVTSYTCGTAVALPTDVTKGNFTFGGWYETEDCSGSPVTQIPADATGNKTYYAKWTALPGSGGSSGGSGSSSKPSVSVGGSGEGGEVKADRDGSVTIIPDEGCEIVKITVNGKEVEIPEGGKLTGLKQTDKVVVTFGEIPAPVPASQRFTDIASGSWYENAVQFAVDNGLFYGTSDTTFTPNEDMSRGMLATVLYRLAQEPEITTERLFSDVEDGQYYAQAVVWAAEAGVVCGYGNGDFGPNDSITREQLAVMLWRYAGSPAASGNLGSFTDGGTASAYALTALRWAVEQGILTGKGHGILDPSGKATRAEAAAMLMRYLQAAEQ